MRAKQEKKDAVVRARAEEQERVEEESMAKEKTKSLKLGAHLAQMKELKRYSRACGLVFNYSFVVGGLPFTTNLHHRPPHVCAPTPSCGRSPTLVCVPTPAGWRCINR